MPSASIRWEKRAVKELASLPRDGQQRIVTAVDGLRAVPLRGERLVAEWKGMRRLRIDAYVVIYAFNGDYVLVLVVRVGPRREIDQER